MRASVRMSTQESPPPASQTQETAETLALPDAEWVSLLLDALATQAIRSLQLAVRALVEPSDGAHLELDWLKSIAILQRRFEALSAEELDRVIRYLPILLEAANRAKLQCQRSSPEPEAG